MAKIWQNCRNQLILTNLECDTGGTVGGQLKEERVGILSCNNQCQTPPSHSKHAPFKTSILDRFKSAAKSDTLHIHEKWLAAGRKDAKTSRTILLIGTKHIWDKKEEYKSYTYHLAFWSVSLGVVWAVACSSDRSPTGGKSWRQRWDDFDVWASTWLEAR